MVERELPKLEAAGSIPVTRSREKTGVQTPVLHFLVSVSTLELRPPQIRLRR